MRGWSRKRVLRSHDRIPRTVNHTKPSRFIHHRYGIRSATAVVDIYIVKSTMTIGRQLDNS